MPAWSTVVRKSLASHSWLGLLTGGLMYLICLSGTLAVFYQELERWEQPNVPEFLRYEPAVAERAVTALLARVPKAPEHLYVGLPTPNAPRMTVGTDEEGQSWFVNADGSLGAPVAHDWTHLLLNLHIYLHLPSTLGLLVVGCLGAMLFSLIVSGFLAHPRIFADAFRLRLGGSRHLEQTDLHNRLSVWGAPFHVAISLTGAYFGLASIVVLLLGAAFHRGDTEAVTTVIYGDEPHVRGDARPPAVAKALDQMVRIAPAGVAPGFMTIHDAGKPEQHLSIDVVQPRRLLWGESYRFAGDGRYLGPVGFADGSVGRQVAYSTYRVHFGHFGGWPVKLLYGLMGLGLTVIAVTGINIWLAKRLARDYLDDVWAGTVWGAPAALALSAITEVLLNVPSTAVFWLALAGAVTWAVIGGHPARTRRTFATLSALLLGALVAGHGATFGLAQMSPAGWWIDAGLLCVAAVMTWVARRTDVTTSARSVAIATAIASLETTPGDRDGKHLDEVRHYATLGADIGAGSADAPSMRGRVDR